jgi:DNA replication protein DnaC
MKGDHSMTTMSFSDLWKYFRFLSDPQSLSQENKSLLQSFLAQEVRLREEKRIQYLLRSSGIKRIKRLIDFDWTFNPKLPKDKIMDFLHTQWLTNPSNLILVGPAGVGKSHIASALCHEAILKGHQTTFLTLFDLTAKLSKAKNLYSLIEYYARVPILCIDELGYIIPSREEADWIFQILSKRTEVTSTIVTTNLTPSNWGKVFDSVTASAILDRLSMNGKFITFEGRSYRSKK